MRLLRLVGPGEDGTSLIVETTGTEDIEQFALPVDERLRNAASSDLPRMPIGESSAARAPSPREIQTRVRAGETAQAVADDAGISLERVMRFAYPVLAERVRVTDEARRARARRGDGHLVEFGELIETRLTSHGIEPRTVSWDAFRRDDGGWTVIAAIPVADAPVLAKFSFALSNRTVSALDDIAADLLSDRPVSALLPPAPEAYDPIPTPTEDLPSRVRLSAVPNHAAPEPADDAAPAAPRQPNRRPKAHTRSVPVGIDDELFDQDAIDPLPDAQPWHEPPLPLDLGEQTPAETEPTPDATAPDPQSPDSQSPDPQLKRGRRGEKPRMPSWDDILLGVRNKTD